jgi:hypothetical protein
MQCVKSQTFISEHVQEKFQHNPFFPPTKKWCVVRYFF